MADLSRDDQPMMIPPETPEVVAPAAPPPTAPPPAAPAGRYAHPLELGTMGLVVAVDQLTKAVVRQVLPLGESRSIVPEFLDLTHVHNTGAAFGLLNAVDFPYKPIVIAESATLNAQKCVAPQYTSTKSTT